MLTWLKVKIAQLFGWAKHIDPPIYVCRDLIEAAARAGAFAGTDPAFVLHSVAPTGSMVPLIPKASCYLVVRKIPFKAARLGTVNTYWPDWLPGQNVVHRFVAKDRLGFIASGDANKHTEAFARVTADNFEGEVVGLWIVQPA